MPVDYKLRSLRRLFGEANFLRPVQTEASLTSFSTLRTTTDAPTAEPDTSSDGKEEPPSRVRRSKAPGGVPRYIFSEQPPRALRNKPAGAQLFTVYLFEKQKMKLYYGALRDYQFKKYVDMAKKKRFNTDAELLRMLELRLDTMLYRSGFVKTPSQGRQWIFHGKVFVNGKRMTMKSTTMRVGDVITFDNVHMEKVLMATRETAEMRERFGCGASWILSSAHPAGMLPWMEIDRTGLAAALVREPSDEEIRAMARAALFPFVRDANLNPHAAMRAYR